MELFSSSTAPAPPKQSVASNSVGLATTAIRPLASAVFFGFRDAVSIETGRGFGTGGANTCIEVNDRARKVGDAYAFFVREFASVSSRELDPGDRYEALSFVAAALEHDADVSFEAIQRVLHSSSRGVTSKAKASLITVLPRIAPHAVKARLVPLMIERLKAESPAEASAAATGLSEVADAYSAPSIRSAALGVRWNGVKSDLDSTLKELCGE